MFLINPPIRIVGSIYKNRNLIGTAEFAGALCCFATPVREDAREHFGQVDSEINGYMGLEEQGIPIRTGWSRSDIPNNSQDGLMVWIWSRTGTQRLQIKWQAVDVARYRKIDVTCGMMGSFGAFLVFSPVLRCFFDLPGVQQCQLDSKSRAVEWARASGRF